VIVKDAQRPAKGSFYRPELDVVRFLAFVLVYLHHTMPSVERFPRAAKALGHWTRVIDSFQPACGFGLSLFFTLSAFLICELLIREREYVGTIHVKQFYIRRILRIWPLYYFGLFLGVVVAFLPGGQISDVFRIGWFVVFMGAWNITLHGLIHNPMNPLWSISVEEQFYVFAPWALKYLSRKWLYVASIGIVLFANLWLYRLGLISASDTQIWFSSVVQFECFAAGILLCLFLHGRMPRLGALTRSSFLAACACCWMAACYFLHVRFYDNGANPGSPRLICGYALGVAGCVLLLLAFLGAAPKHFPRWAVYLGRISFGLYVYHDFVINFTRRLVIDPLMAATIQNNLVRDHVTVGLSMALPFGLTIVVAALSYRYLETPFLKMKRRHAVIESQPIGITSDRPTKERIPALADGSRQR
jgi:peptidoglycan/LPS O-acetylase OafA/YrhL